MGGLNNSISKRYFLMSLVPRIYCPRSAFYGGKKGEFGVVGDWVRGICDGGENTQLVGEG